MKAWRMAAGFYLVVMAGWVIVHFFGHTFGEDHPEEPTTGADERFATLDAFMALAFLLTSITAYQAVRRAAKQSPPAPGWFVSNLFFYLTVLVAIPFFANWFASMGHTDDGLLWIYVETAGPVTWGIQAVRLWRSAGRAGRVTA
ncbi:MAG: hypothetical protein F4196_10875 [Acidimicrobiia bacterium]|nr:hypothetical protein [Acidimicrobiia bacterium]